METSTLTLLAAAVAALGSVAGPLVLYFTRKGAINDRVNDRIDQVRSDVHDDVDRLSDRIDQVRSDVHDDIGRVYNRIEQVDREAKARSEAEQRELRSISRDVSFLAGRQAERDALRER